MAYATVEQLQTLMGRDTPFSEAETAKAQLLLTIATGMIDAETGQTLEHGAVTSELDGTGTTVLLLPRWPVTAVSSVTVIDDLDEAPKTLVEDDDYRWSSYGRLRRRRCRWPCIERAVEVVYTAGWDPIPDDVVGICLRLAQAGWDNFGGLESERLGDWSAKYAVPGMRFTTSDLATLGRYSARS